MHLAAASVAGLRLWSTNRERGGEGPPGCALSRLLKRVPSTCRLGKPHFQDTSRVGGKYLCLCLQEPLLGVRGQELFQVLSLICENTSFGFAGVSLWSLTVEVNPVMRLPPTHIPSCFCDIPNVDKAYYSHGGTTHCLNHSIATPGKVGRQRALVTAPVQSQERGGCFPVGGGQRQPPSPCE